LPAMLGLGEADTLDALLAPVVEADRPALEAALAATLEDGLDSALEVQAHLPLTGELIMCAVSLVSLSDREGAPGALVCLTDVTESARMREELEAKATFDVLTGCHNRASITAILDHALTSPDGRLTAVVFIDLDRFKSVNDTMGHAAGDEMLVHAAGRLSGLLRRDDTVGRIGGDEFLFISRGLDSEQDALALAGRVREALHQPVALAGGTVELWASIGVACSEPGLDSTALTRRADHAMYQSKQRGLGRPVLYGSPPD
jgi:diguanylate cyclase (GGDEF)-like protein